MLIPRTNMSLTTSISKAKLTREMQPGGQLHAAIGRFIALLPHHQGKVPGSTTEIVRGPFIGIGHRESTHYLTIWWEDSD